MSTLQYTYLKVKSSTEKKIVKQKFEFFHLFPVLIGLKSAKHCPTNLERCAILIYILHSVPCMKIAYFFDHKRK